MLSLMQLFQGLFICQVVNISEKKFTSVTKIVKGKSKFLICVRASWIFWIALYSTIQSLVKVLTY